mmetsp:Transcript_3029/g.3394  ORF Transcript_3029/g.3394 Transcript_3029/m.3394 type:complete len:108 (+) Transcript_3029:105-428(+)
MEKKRIPTKHKNKLAHKGFVGDVKTSEPPSIVRIRGLTKQQQKKLKQKGFTRKPNSEYVVPKGWRVDVTQEVSQNVQEIYHIYHNNKLYATGSVTTNIHSSTALFSF